MIRFLIGALLALLIIAWVPGILLVCIGAFAIIRWFTRTLSGGTR